MVALVLCGICLILVVLEIFFCWRAHRSSSEGRDHVVETEYLPVKFKPNYQGEMWGVSYSTNSYGFRDEPDFPAERQRGEKRVFSMGDSIGFGVGIKAEEHYCKVAERLIQKRFPQVDLKIINASGQGYSPSGYYVYLRNEGIHLNPAMVIVEIELCNDLTDEALLRWESDGGPYPAAVTGGRYRVAWDGNLLGTYSLGNYPWEKTYVYTDLLRRSLNLLNRSAPSPLFTTTPGGSIYYSLGFDRFLLDQARIEDGWARLLGALKATNELCSAHQIPFLVLLMPSRHVFEDIAPDHRDLALSLLTRAESEVRARGIPLVNMRPAIVAAGGSTVYFDFAHLTAEGNRPVGETLAEPVAQLIGVGTARTTGTE
jgi:hypothetical protein